MFGQRGTGRKDAYSLLHLQSTKHSPPMYLGAHNILCTQIILIIGDLYLSWNEERFVCKEEKRWRQRGSTVDSCPRIFSGIAHEKSPDMGIPHEF